jgi:hypothetical protein
MIIASDLDVWRYVWMFARTSRQIVGPVAISVSPATVHATIHLMVRRILTGTLSASTEADLTRSPDIGRQDLRPAAGSGPAARSSGVKLRARRADTFGVSDRVEEPRTGSWKT